MAHVRSIINRRTAVVPRHDSWDFGHKDILQASVAESARDVEAGNGAELGETTAPCCA